MTSKKIGILGIAVFIGFISGCAVDQNQEGASTKPIRSYKELYYNYKETYTMGRCPKDAIPEKAYQVYGQWYQPLPCARGFRQRGIASWYGYDFHGKRTSSGEIYDMFAISAAHKTLPLGTYVRVYNLENGRTLDVIINDRGPFIPGRIIDLSYEAGLRLGIIGPGTAPVEIVALSEPVPLPNPSNDIARTAPKSYNFPVGNYSVQIGAFSDYRKAKEIASGLNSLYSHADVRPYQRGNDMLYRVTVGKWPTIEKAGEYENILKQQGFYDAFVIAE